HHQPPCQSLEVRRPKTAVRSRAGWSSAVPVTGGPALTTGPPPLVLIM
ncbi:hypothetical protein A2U01_0113684, partial [Trifolium medium]|nr:hypothetical protein [Trifolium medium]